MSSPTRGWYVVSLLMLANLSGFIDRLIPTLLVDAFQRDLHLSLTQIGLLIGLPFAVFYSLVGLPIARLADRSNRRNIISGGIALWSVMTALCGLAGSFWRLFLARVGVGVGEATLQAPATSLIPDLFPRERLGFAMSVYGTGTFIGSGMAYFIGGWIVGLMSTQSSWTVPLVGEVRPWQSVFFVVGLPGLVIALLMRFTVREPDRRGHVGAQPFSAVFDYIRGNFRAFATLTFGFTLSATVNFGLAGWLAKFLSQTYGWPLSRAGMVQGILTMTVGTVGVLLGGRLSDSFFRRGKTDGPLRVGIIGALGMLVSATAYPFAPTATIAVAWLVVVNFFAAFPWGAASAATAEILPPAIRAQGAAMFILFLNLISFALGPLVVPAIAEKVLGSATMLPYSLALVNVVGMVGAILFFVLGMPAYRGTLARLAESTPSIRR